jgi:ABC-type transport system involved in cytochrome c biogenesis ATPase subunit
LLRLGDNFYITRNLVTGQKYRYRIAKLIENKKQWWLIAEFAACVDRDTAKIIVFVAPLIHLKEEANGRERALKNQRSCGAAYFLVWFFIE